MKVSKNFILATCMGVVGITAIAATVVKPINNVIRVRSTAQRSITLNYENTYRGLYEKNVFGGNFKEDLCSVFFKMQDDQAYGYIHTSGSIVIKPEDNCIAAFWSQGSTCYFEVNSDYMQYTDHYTSQSDESVVTMVEFRRPTQIIVVLDKGNAKDPEAENPDRCLDISCSECDKPTYVDDAGANSRTITYNINEGISEGKEIEFNAKDAGSDRAIWIRSMTFYYDC